MSNFLFECMAIAIKGTIGMLCIIAIIVLALGIFVGMIEFIKAMLPSKKKPSPEAACEPTNNAVLEEELFTVIDGGKETDEL